MVEQLGPLATYLKKGDRVGWGYQHDSCGHCQECLKGTETYCKERAMYAYANTDQGSFASHAVWKEAFLFKIPDEISDEAAAPLMVSWHEDSDLFSLVEEIFANILSFPFAVRWCYRLQCSPCIQCPAYRDSWYLGCGRSRPSCHSVRCCDGHQGRCPLGNGQEEG